MAAYLPLVGRRAELALLTSALTPGQEPRAVVLVGEAGVGKTRLITEAIRAVADQGVPVLSGACLPLAETVPFLPIAEALRGLDQDPSPVRDAVARLMAGPSVELIPATVEATAVGSTAQARAYLETLSGDREAASARLAELDAVLSPVNLEGGAHVTALGEIDLWLGRPAQALARIRQLAGGLDPDKLSGFTGPMLRVGATACADLAESARLRGDTDGMAEARGWAAELVSAHEEMRPDPFAAHPFWSFAAAEGATWRAELTRVSGVPDPKAWVAAADEWARLKRPHRVAYARWRQGEALLAAGKRAEAAGVLRKAADGAGAHAPLTAGIQETAKLARLALPARHAPPAQLVPAVASEPVPYGLTARETAVLALVAEGLANVQIGRRLFISESTVSVHITNLMRKLGVSNRAQAAARGQRAGLII